MQAAPLADSLQDHNAPAESRVTIGRAGALEFQILEGIRHSGILHADDYRETERGPALIFAHEPDALRLDHSLNRYHASLDAGQRLALIRRGVPPERPSAATALFGGPELV